MNDQPVLIVGGGPAGSTLGCYLSMAGVPNIIIERANHPRPHVGESLVPATTSVMREIGFLPTMERVGFIKKFGAAWHSPVTDDQLSMQFSEFPLENGDQDHTYHVDRSQFDLLLLKHAESLGSTVYQGVPVTGVLRDGERLRGVRIKIAGQVLELPAALVVDASGRDTLLGNHLRLKEKDPHFNQYAVHAWYDGVERGPGDSADYIHIYFLPVEKGWIWQIPVSDTVTSMGVVTEKETFASAQSDWEAFFNHHVQTTPAIRRAMRQARRVSEFKAEGDYSYSMRRFVGDGYMLIGDAARFVDPIFSSGISVALHSARLAAGQIVPAWKKEDFRAETLQPFEDQLRSGVEIWYEFIRLYYRMLPLFTHFIQKPQYRSQLFRLLQGDVFDREEAPVLAAMRNYIAAIESDENHLFRSQLLDIPIPAERFAAGS